MKKPKNYELIMDVCLKRILEGGESFADVIADYPDHQGQLRVDIDTALWFHQKGETVAPRSGFIQSSRRNMVQRLENNSRQERSWHKRLTIKDTLWVQGVLAALVLLVFYYGGLMVAVDRSLPGDQLYRVKIAMEDLRLMLTLDAAKDARLHRMYAQDHLIACARVKSLGRYEDAEFALRYYERHMVGLSRTVLALSRSSSVESTWRNIDVSHLYLEDMEIIKALLPGSF
jgi:hypothetical protein